MKKRRKKGEMPISLQLYHIQKFLTNRGVDPHGSELEDLMDSTLEYEENKAEILSYYGLSEGHMNEKDALKDQVAARYAARSKQAQKTDEAIKAKKTYTPAQLLKDDEKADEWFEHPEGSDIKGVDVKEGAKRRKQRKKQKKQQKGREIPTEEQIKERTIGILGQKGTGKTFLTRAFILNLKNKVVIFDTIGAISKTKINAKVYEVVAQEIEKQAIGWGVLSSKTNKNVCVDLSRLTRSEILLFTNVALRQAEYKDKVIVVDEIADYLPEQAKKSEEMERLIRHGRNEGCAFIFNTQRPAQISKNTLNLVDILIVFRLVWNRDLEVLEELYSNIGKTKTEIPEEINKISKQGVGECKVYTFHS